MTYRCPHHIRIGWIQRELICKTMSFRIKYQSLVAFFINQLYALQCKRLITSHTELKFLSHKYQTASIVAVFCMRKQMFQMWIVIVIGFLCCVHNNQVRLIICINILVMEMHIRLPLFNHTYSWPEGTTNWRFCPLWSNVNRPIRPHNQLIPNFVESGRIHNIASNRCEKAYWNISDPANYHLIIIIPNFAV